MPKDMHTIIRPLPSAMLGVEPVFARTNRTFARHFHDQFGIGVVLSGAQRSASGRGAVEANRGDVITVNPGEVHDGAPIDGRIRTWTMLYLDTDRVADIALDVSEGRSAQLELAHPVQTDRPASSLFRRIFRSLLRGQQSETTSELLILLLDQLADRRTATNNGTGVPFGLRRDQQAIDDDPSASHSLDALAGLAGIGRFQLIRAFSAQTGMTPHYVVQRRLLLARRLLCQGLSPARASAEAGFADQSHLTRLFMRNYGMTPAAYRRSRN